MPLDGYIYIYIYIYIRTKFPPASPPLPLLIFLSPYKWGLLKPAVTPACPRAFNLLSFTQTDTDSETDLLWRSGASVCRSGCPCRRSASGRSRLFPEFVAHDDDDDAESI